MGQRVGSVERGELWARCPACGDSKRNPHKGHLSINIRKSLFYCVRCGYGGKLTVQQSLELAFQYDDYSITIDQPMIQVDVEEGAGSHRFSALQRSHHLDEYGRKWDLFTMRDPIWDEPVGQNLRCGKRSITVGERGMAWPISGYLVSTEENPLRIVEGPYDVLQPQDVCVFGLSAFSSVRKLKGHYIILCPDGDVWEGEALTERMYHLICQLLLDSHCGPVVMGLEMIPDGLDPDQCKVEDRLFVSREELMRRVVMPNRVRSRFR
jgi:hypothetical protein